LEKDKILKNILLDTIPANARNIGSVNLGYEITKNKFDLEYCHWRDVLDSIPEIIYANIFYPTHIFNLIGFLKRNNIPLLKNERVTKIIVGGQGVSNLNGCLNDIVDEIFLGESDGTEIDKKGWFRKKEITSDPIIKNKKAVIELTRGCKYKCSFCEYSWVHGGKFREKDIALVKEQVDFVKNNGINQVNFLSANFGSYGDLEELGSYCDINKIRVLNSDLCLRDFDQAKNVFGKRSSIKVGVESFDEITRKSVNKQMSDENLLKFFYSAINYTSNIHCYLIFGLPNDNYQKWFDWLKTISDMRKQIERPIRIEFNITNFEPCLGTPLENANMVNFEEKDIFLKEWINNLVDLGFRKKRGDHEITYKNSGGRLGRKEKSYKLLMNLKTQDSKITNAIIGAFSNGVGRSILDKQADKFLDLL